ncbi:hypothetical protein CONCODRAFT_2427 [Conidiobolus coronatus NRRL 28638]|uniref:Uncharacterized protein n=1 Tax=Conidiobolus coronatus (strain ATCC 28846 / CBS 209.66 / NRRL 28638) TaxID=796925 RepID=A0A137PHY5_CONC2|nr:hypothetical protein CONCODRAFT_2427 [Conidiobolus coronatus NRRL 28638]|eukprot:KXN74618.1 hypothetical protein CONCODRAFT_2427 [Conidiobolus coronatus NRRL 28638]
MKISLNSLAPILAYCASSITMTLVNRYLMQAFKPYLFFMLSIQAGACVLLIHIFKTFKLVSAKAFNLDDAKKWLPVSVLQAVMLYTGAQR